MRLKYKHLKIWVIPLSIMFFLFFLTFIVQAQDSESIFKRVQWQKGPSIADLGKIAKVNIPLGYLFADGNDTRLLMEAMKNLPSGAELGFVAPGEFDWYVVFEFDETGYIKDDEKHSLDADAILKTLKTSNEKGNEERRKRGWPIMTIIGWERKPHYNTVTHNLEWATRIESEGSLAVNYNTRLLGRGGVMRVTLVTDPPKLNETLPKFKSVIDMHAFNQGHKYTEFRQGDKIAKYGLTGLIVGGATAVAVKTGAFKWLWKVGIAVLVGAGALLRKLFRRREV